MRSVIFIYFALIFLFNNVCAQTIIQTEASADNLSTDNVKPIRVIFSSYTPPYVFENGNGIVIDIVTEALKPAGYNVVPVFCLWDGDLKCLLIKKLRQPPLLKRILG